MKKAFVERWAPAILIASSALFFFVAFRPQFDHLREKEPTKPLIYEDQINDHGKQLLKEAQVEGSYSFDERGLVLGPGQKVRITYTFAKDPFPDMWLEMRFFYPPDGTNRLEVIRPDTDNPYILERKMFFEGTPVDLTQFLQGAREFTVILTAEASSSAPQSLMVFDSIRIISAPRIVLPSLPLLVSMISAALLFWHWLGAFGRLSPIYKLLACEGFLIALSGIVTVVGIFVQWTILPVVLPGILLILRRMRTRDAQLAKPLLMLVFILILWLGTLFRWGFFMQKQNAPIEPDCNVYLSLASNLTSPFKTDFREPLFIWIVRIFTSLTASNGLNLRLMTVLLSVLCIWITYEVGRRLLGEAAALVGSFFVAMSPMTIDSASHGLRLELSIVTLLPFFYFAMRRSTKPMLSDALELGSWAGLNHLNILSSYTFTTPLMVYKFIRDRFTWWSAALAILLAWLIVAPYLVHAKKQFGDPFYAVNIHAKYYRNREFAGTPGFFTVDEVLQNGYVGPPTTTFHYVFGMHSLPDILINSAKGWWAIYIDKFAQRAMTVHPVFLVPYVAGMIMLLLEPRRDMLLAYFLLAASLFFVVGKLPGLVPPRLTDHIVPVGFLITGYGVTRLVSLAAKLTSPGSHTETKHAVRTATKRRKQ